MCPEGRQPGGSLETSNHLLDCRVYQDLREGLESGPGAGGGEQSDIVKDPTKDGSSDVICK